METYALDFESYYDKACSIKRLGPLGYFSHPDFDAYMVSVVGENEYQFVGHPKDFDWGILKGSRVLSHNASFDETLYFFGVKKGWWPSVEFAEWQCTADMVAACGLPRSLKNATAEAFGLEISKTTRDNMATKRWESMPEDFQKEVSDYALKDSVLCLRLWQEYKDKWPDHERLISLTNRRIIQRGLPMDTDLLKEQLETINQRLFEAQTAIPWAGERPLLSRAAFDDECIKCGLEPPKSLAQTDLDTQEWIRQHGYNYKWVGAVTNWRRINALKKKLEAFDYATLPDGRYYGGLMYWGGHTGRFSGSGGNLNLQNLPREEMFGVNLRHMISAPKGKKLVVVDLSQIEVRTLCWLAEDKETLQEIANTGDIYEAFAIRMGLWTKDKGVLKSEDPKLRHKVKAIVLGCGYGAGANKFSEMYNMPLAEAKEAVNLYRTQLHKVPKFWQKINNTLKSCHNSFVPFECRLPSGRALNYGPLKLVYQNERLAYQAIVSRNGKRLPMKLWGGVVAENMSQGLARDIFSDMLLRLEAEGIRLIFHVHDEVIIECDEGEAEMTLKKTIGIMSTPPAWISDIPLAAEGQILTHYQK
jgi:DNA polymerase I-like protein with 3'-5' exonuclease and polymerase domains